MDLESSLDQMDVGMKENGIRIRCMVMACLDGQMEGSTADSM